MTNEKTIIEIGESSLDYYKKYNSIISAQKYSLISILTFVFITLSVIFSCLQYFSWDPLYQLEKFKRIKTNMGNWRKLVEEKTAIEVSRGRNAALKSHSDIYDYKCYDFDLYFAALKLNRKNYLSTFIQRGIGGPWMIKKGTSDSGKDVSASQFCEFIISNYSDQEITCGTDMYDKLGYGGWFEIGNPCQTALTKIKNNNV